MAKTLQPMLQRGKQLMRQRHAPQILEWSPRPQLKPITNHAGNQHRIAVGNEAELWAIGDFDDPADWFSDPQNIMLHAPANSFAQRTIRKPQPGFIRPPGKTCYFCVPPSIKGISRPRTFCIISKASFDDRCGICEINRSPSSLDISGITFGSKAFGALRDRTGFVLCFSRHSRVVATAFMDSR